MCNVLYNLWCESNHFMSVACYLVSMLITMACWRGGGGSFVGLLPKPTPLIPGLWSVFVQNNCSEGTMSFCKVRKLKRT